MANDTKIRRVKASETGAVTASAAKQSSKKSGLPRSARKDGRKKTKRSAPKWLKAIGRALGKFFGPVGRYVKGAWQELRVTKWPNRKATWGLTLAVIVFSVLFAALILSFDNLFQWLVELLLNIGE